MSAQQLPIDPDVKIPAAVRAAANAADEMHKSIFSPPANNDDPPSDPPKEPAANEPPKEPVAAEPPKVPEPQPKSNDVDWQRKFNGMEGRYKQQVSQLTEQLTAMQSIVEQLQGQLNARMAAQPVQTEKLLTPEEESEFGNDFLTVVGKKAKEELTPEVRELRTQIDALKQRLERVDNTVVLSAQERMFQMLDRDVENWKALNHDENFLAWLKLPDPYSGAIRHELMKAAFGRNDAKRVAAFFKGFLAEEAATSPADDQPHASEATPPTKVPLESFAAPGRAKSAASTSLPAEKPSFTSAQISQFYVDKSRGKWRGRETEAEKLERQIHDAVREGRVRQ